MKKSRYWGFITYPTEFNDKHEIIGGVPLDWLDRLTMSGLPIAISPLHDMDTNPDGTVKKPHWHVLLAFDGPTTENCIKDIADQVNGTTVIPINSCKGMYRYHLHLDNPEKYPYWQYCAVGYYIKDKNKDHKYYRTLLNGFDIENYAQLTQQEVTMMYKMILDIIRSNSIYFYSDLLDKLQEEDLQAFTFAMNHTLVFNSYCKSRKDKLERLNKKKK